MTAPVRIDKLVIAGVGLIGASFALWSQAKGLEDDAYALCPETNCTDTEAMEATALIDDARSRAMVGNVFLGVGVAAAVGSGVLWYTRPKHHEGVAVRPLLGATNGVALTGAF